MKVNIINKSTNPNPEFATANSAGADLRAHLLNTPAKDLQGFNAYVKEDTENKEIVIRPLGRALIPTGIYIALPEGYEAQIRPRSGLALKKGITVLNSPGTIDADYRGEVCVILVNLGSEEFTIKQGDRIAQMVIAEHSPVEWVNVETLDETARGEGGFGHTGIKEIPEVMPEVQDKPSGEPLLKAEEILTPKKETKKAKK